MSVTMSVPRENPATDPELVEVESEAEAALGRRERERRAMSAKEFVSERDALEDAWTGSADQRARDEGW